MDSPSRLILLLMIVGVSSLDAKTPEAAKPQAFIFPKNLAKAQVFEGAANLKGKFFSLSANFDFWFDLTKVKTQGFLNKLDNICVSGVWIGYKKANFLAKTKSDVALISGEKICVGLNTFPGLASLQPLTRLFNRKESTLSFFPKENCNGAVVPVHENFGQGMISEMSEVKSLVTIGKDKWTIYPVKGDPICIIPQGTDSTPICILPKLTDGSILKVGKFLQINKGCEKKVSLNLTISACISYESKKFYPLSNIKELKGRALSSAASNNSPLDEDWGAASGGSCPTGVLPQSVAEPGKLQLLKTLLDLKSHVNTNYMWPKDKKHLWKLELLENSIDIVLASCPPSMITPIYLQLVREIHAFHLSNAWQTKDTIGDDIDPDLWMKLNLQLKTCGEIIKSMPGGGIIEDTKDIFQTVRSPNSLKDVVEVVLQMREKHDYVIETVWLTANHVAATCHFKLGYVDDFWTNYIQTFSNLYLVPVEKVWSKADYNTVYKYALGGYGIEATYNKLGMCATTALHQVYNLDPFYRPLYAKSFVVPVIPQKIS